MIVLLVSTLLHDYQHSYTTGQWPSLVYASVVADKLAKISVFYDRIIVKLFVNYCFVITNYNPIIKDYH